MNSASALASSVLPEWASGICEPGLCHRHPLDDRLDGLGLTEDTAGEELANLLEPQRLVGVEHRQR
jgi:hypothetical protein